MRADHDGNYKDSTPCKNCLNIIIGLNIKRIVYSSGINTFTSCCPCNIERDHTSAGTKFIKNRDKKTS